MIMLNKWQNPDTLYDGRLFKNISYLKAISFHWFHLKIIYKNQIDPAFLVWFEKSLNDFNIVVICSTGWFSAIIL